MNDLEDNLQDRDTTLVTQVRTGNINAFRTLVDLYKDKCLSLAVSILKDNAIVEDVLQEVFIKVYKKVNTFQFKAKFSTWLYRIVVNTCYNELRKHKNTQPLYESEYVNVAKIEQTQFLTLEDQKKYIRVAMAQIKPDEALVLRLFYLCEMDLKEVASISGFSASKVRVDLHRGRKHLKEQLYQLLGEEIHHLL